MKFNTSWDKFKFFYQVAQAGSFSEAANILHITQSALSRSVKSLEDQLDVRLFDRLPRGVALTPKGAFLYDSVGKIHDEFLKHLARCNLMKPNQRVCCGLRLFDVWSHHN